MNSENKEQNTERRQDRMLKFFEYSHLPPHLQAVSQRFHKVAAFIDVHLEPGPERTVALRKLLESKDAAVRSEVYKGG